MDGRGTVVVVNTGGEELTRSAVLRLVCWASGRTEQGGSVTTGDVMGRGWAASEHDNALYITCPNGADALVLEDFLMNFGPRVVPHWQGVWVAHRVYITVAVPEAGKDDTIVYLGPFAHAAEARDYTRGWQFRPTGRYAFVPALAEHWHAVGIESEANLEPDALVVRVAEHDTLPEVARRVAGIVWGSDGR